MDLPDAVLFDLDGVLVDSRVPFARCVNAALADNGLPTHEESDLHCFIGPPIHQTFERLGAAANTQACVDAYRARYAASAAQLTRVFDGIPEILGKLAARVPLAVATSKPHALAAPLLDSLGLGEFFTTVSGPDLQAKNETKAVTIGRALQSLLDTRSAVMVGDRRYDVEGAAEHGLPTIGVLWGIGDAAELEQAGAMELAGTPQELLRILGL